MADTATDIKQLCESETCDADGAFLTHAAVVCLAEEPITVNTLLPAPWCTDTGNLAGGHWGRMACGGCSGRSRARPRPG